MPGRSAGTPTVLRCSVQGRAVELTTLNFVSLRSYSAHESDIEARKRADPEPPLLAAPEIAPAGYRLPRCHRLWSSMKSKSWFSQRDRIGLSNEHPTPFSKGAFGQVGGRL